MTDFLTFFNDIADKYHLHLEIGYNKIADWGIYVYQGYDESIQIVNVSGCDISLCFAKAQVQLKEWLLENKGGY